VRNYLPEISGGYVMEVGVQTIIKSKL